MFNSQPRSHAYFLLFALSLASLLLMSLTSIVGTIFIIGGSLSALIFVQWVLLCELGEAYPFGSFLRSLYPPSWTASLPVTQYNALSFSTLVVGHFLYTYGAARTALFSLFAFFFMMAVETVGTRCPFGVCPFGRYEWLPPLKSGYPFEEIRVFGDVALLSVLSTSFVYFGYSYFFGQFVATSRPDISRRSLVAPALISGLSAACLSFMVEQSGYGPYDTTCFARVGAFDIAATPDAFILNHIPVRNHLLWAPIAFIFSITLNLLSTALFGEAPATSGGAMSVLPIVLLTTTPVFYALLFSRPLLVRQVAFSSGMVAPLLYWIRFAVGGKGGGAARDVVTEKKETRRKRD